MTRQLPLTGSAANDRLKINAVTTRRPVPRASFLCSGRKMREAGEDVMSFLVGGNKRLLILG